MLSSTIKNNTLKKSTPIKNPKPITNNKSQIPRDPKTNSNKPEIPKDPKTNKKPETYVMTTEVIRAREAKIIETMQAETEAKLKEKDEENEALAESLRAAKEELERLRGAPLEQANQEQNVEPEQKKVKFIYLIL